MRDLLAGDILRDVVRLSLDDHPYVVPDQRAALDPFISYHLPQRIRDMPAESVLSDLARTEAATVHFGAIPDGFREALHPDDEVLYATEEAFRRAEQFTWLSSPGVRTHTHFECAPGAYEF